MPTLPLPPPPLPPQLPPSPSLLLTSPRLPDANLLLLHSLPSKPARLSHPLLLPLNSLPSWLCRTGTAFELDLVASPFTISSSGNSPCVCFLSTPQGLGLGPLINCTLKPCDRRLGVGGVGGEGERKKGRTASSFLPLSLFEWQLSEVKRAFAESGASVLLEVLSRPLVPVASPSFLKQTQRAVEEDGREEPPEGMPRHIAGRKVHHQRSDVA